MYNKIEDEFNKNENIYYNYVDTLYNIVENKNDLIERKKREPFTIFRFGFSLLGLFTSVIYSTIAQPDLITNPAILGLDGILTASTIETLITSYKYLKSNNNLIHLCKNEKEIKKEIEKIKLNMKMNLLRNLKEENCTNLNINELKVALNKLSFESEIKIQGFQDTFNVIKNKDKIEVINYLIESMEKLYPFTKEYKQKNKTSEMSKPSKITNDDFENERQL